MLNSKSGVATTGTEGEYYHQRANRFDSADGASGTSPLSRSTAAGPRACDWPSRTG